MRGPHARVRRPDCRRSGPRIRPHVYVKGGDYSEAELPEAQAARQAGARVVILSRTLPSSTTALIERVRRLPDLHVESA